MIFHIFLACASSLDGESAALDTIDTVNFVPDNPADTAVEPVDDSADFFDSGETEDSGDPPASPVTALSLVQERLVGGTSIWAYPIFSGEEMWLSTMQNGQVSIVPIDYGLEFIGTPIPISEQQDLRPNVTVADHAFTEWNGNFYFAVSGAGDEDLVLIQTDNKGLRLGSVILQRGFDVPTNDPHIVHTADQVCVRWGISGPSKKVHCFDEQLNSTDGVQDIPSPVNVPQLGMTVWHDQEYWTFTGEETQRSLAYHRFTSDWVPIEPGFQNIIIPSENDEWNWFSSGVVYHEIRDIWVVAYTHMASTGNADTDATVRIALFDGMFNLLQMEEISGPGYTRPHIALQDDELLVAYDSANEVWLEHWQLTDVYPD